MASVNKVILVGNLGRDPEVRYTPDGMAVSNVSLATTNSWKDKNTGQRREETEWHRVVFHARLAEIVGEYLIQGSKIYVEGRLRTRKWKDRAGQDRYTTEVVADQMQMLGGKSNHPAQQAAAPTQSPQPSRQDSTQQQPGDLDDDIPF